MKNEVIDLHETPFIYTFAEATRVSNCWSKGISAADGKVLDHWPKAYYTAIRNDSKYEGFCWQVTNRFDPRVKGN